MNQPMNQNYNQDHDASVAAPAFGDAESALQQNRDVLRQRLAQREQEKRSLDGVSDFVEIAAPLARRLVRKHPYAAIGGAAVVGALLARGNLWRTLGGSLIAGAVAREVVKVSLSSGRSWLERLNSAAEAEDSPPP